MSDDNTDPLRHHNDQMFCSTQQTNTYIFFLEILKL